MADEVKKEAKTKALGFLPIEKLETLKGWKDYTAKAKAFSEAKEAAETAKELIRSELKKRLKETGDFDFIIEAGGKRIRMWENLEVKNKTGARDRSADF
jgi:hypothetical protein